jgi:hypothetical protein
MYLSITYLAPLKENNDKMKTYRVLRFGIWDKVEGIGPVN